MSYEQDKRWRDNNREHWLKLHREQMKRYRLIHSDEERSRKKDWISKNREKHLESQRRYYRENRERLCEYRRKYAKLHPEKIRRIVESYKPKRRIYERKKIKTNPMFRLSRNIGTVMYESLKGNKAGRKWESLVGYTLQELKNHLEGKFVLGMSWNNYGKWHIDHVKPRSSFQYVSPEDFSFKECWALQNLQPLWAADNIKKSHRYCITSATPVSLG